MASQQHPDNTEYKRDYLNQRLGGRPTIASVFLMAYAIGIKNTVALKVNRIEPNTMTKVTLMFLVFESKLLIPCVL